MTRKYFDHDADLGFLTDKVVSILGYGNQGSSQAMNLRDSGINVIVGSNLHDESEARAKRDGFRVASFEECVLQADVLMLLLPDEILPRIFHDVIQSRLRPRHVLCFASGYNVYYKLITLPAFVDVVMLAPRMIGRAVRELFLQGSGAPALVAVGQDASGQAHQIVLALAKGIGVTRTLALESSFEEETIADLLGEQAACGAMLFLSRMVCEVLMEAGCSPEAALLEVYASGENIAIAKAINELGLWNQLRLHSRTSQYGHQTRGPRLVTEETRDNLRQLVSEIKDGTFQREWTRIQAEGMRDFDAVWEDNLQHPILAYEDQLYRILGRRK